jgi:hypothetical protein
VVVVTGALVVVAGAVVVVVVAGAVDVVVVAGTVEVVVAAPASVAARPNSRGAASEAEATRSRPASRLRALAFMATA